MRVSQDGRFSIGVRCSIRIPPHRESVVRANAAFTVPVSSLSLGRNGSPPSCAALAVFTRKRNEPESVRISAYALSESGADHGRKEMLQDAEQSDKKVGVGGSICASGCVIAL